MEKLKVGIIGFGRIGAEHARWLASACNAGAVAAADLTPARRALAEQRGLRTYADHLSLLKDDEVQAVLVSTPTAMHHDHAADAIAAGKHVMIEKPMALHLPESQEIFAKARAANRVISVFHNRRWDPDYLILRHAIESEVFGRIINVESRIDQWASCVGPAAREWRPNWRNEAAYGGGGLYDWGSHLVDQLWRLLHPARPVRVFAQLRGNVWSTDCDDFARVCIDFDNGAAGMVEINTTTTRPLPRWHIDGTLGSAESPYSLSFDLATWSQFKFTAADGSSSHALSSAPAGLSETQMWERFAAAIAGHDQPAVAVESVLPTMTLLDAAKESAASGRAVELGNQVQWTL